MSVTIPLACLPLLGVADTQGLHVRAAGRQIGPSVVEGIYFPDRGCAGWGHVVTYAGGPQGVLRMLRCEPGDARVCLPASAHVVRQALARLADDPVNPGEGLRWKRTSSNGEMCWVLEGSPTWHHYRHAPREDGDDSGTTVIPTLDPTYKHPPMYALAECALWLARAARMASIPGAAFLLGFSEDPVAIVAEIEQRLELPPLEMSLA